jgi:hypothetical protein
MALTTVNAQMVSGAITTSSTGNVSIGSTTVSSNLSVYGAGSGTFSPYNDPLVVQGSDYSLLYVKGTNGISASVYSYNASNGWYTGTNNSASYRIGYMSTIDSTGITNAKDGSAGITVTSGSNVGVGTASPGYKFHVVQTVDNFACGLTNSNGSTPYGQTIIYSGAAPANTDYGFLYCSDTSNQKLVIYSSGTVSNRTGTYNALSDIKIKQDISDASSQWDDIKAVKFRKYRLIDDVKANADAPYFLGVVAQELEETSPNLIDEAPDTVNKEDGTIEYLGTSTKQVKYSILYMKAVKALQEAMERIEAIEAKVDAQAAEIAALKAAP